MNLGLCHETGEGTTKSYAEARRLYKRALAQGYAQAAEYLKRLDEKIHTECPLLGKRVSITGTSRGDLNGRAGVATSFGLSRGVGGEGSGHLSECFVNCALTRSLLIAPSLFSADR